MPRKPQRKPRPSEPDNSSSYVYDESDNFISPRDSVSVGTSPGEKIPTSIAVNFSFATLKTREVFLEIEPLITRTKTITPRWVEYLKSNTSARNVPVPTF